MRSKLFTVLILVVLITISGCSNKPSRDAKGYWESANQLLKLENFEGAVAQYGNICKFFPEDTLAENALFAMADVYKNSMKEADKAINIYQKIIDNHSDSKRVPNAMFMIGYIYANDKQDYEMAKKSYNKFISAYPDHMLAASAKWEMEFMGKSLEEIPQLEILTDTTAAESN